MLLATEALPETRLHFCHFPAVFQKNACFSVAVCALVELWGVYRTETAGVGVGISIFVSVSLFFSVYVSAFIYIHFFQLVSDEPQGLV